MKALSAVEHYFDKYGYRRNRIMRNGQKIIGPLIDAKNILSKKQGWANREMSKDYVAVEMKRSGIVRHEKKNYNWIS